MDTETPIQHGGISFSALSESNLGHATSQKLNYWETFDELTRDIAHFRGALLRLFGAPLEESDLSDEAFWYIIEATDDQGHTWILTAYQGASGPAIGGNVFDETVYPAAQALVSLIRAASPDDYEATVYDGDLDWTVTYGVRKGEYFYQEVRGNQIRSKSSDAEQ